MAQSITGTGLGSSKKMTTKELAILANAPSILAAGRINIDAEDHVSSPPSSANTVTLDRPLPGGNENYVVILTGLNTGSVYVGAMLDNEDGDFYRFVILSESEGTCMYLVTKCGTRPNI